MGSSTDATELLAGFDETLDTRNEQLDRALSLLDAVGYDEDEVSLEQTFAVDIDPVSDPLAFPAPQERVTADVVVTPETVREPYLVLNLRYTESPYHAQGNRGELTRIDENMARDFRDITGAELSVVLTNHSITIDDGGEDRCQFHLLDNASLEDIVEVLERPEQIPADQATWTESTQKELSTEHETLDLSVYRNRLSEVFESTSNKAKKESLEELADLLFDSIEYTTVRSQNLIAPTSEIDLIVEYTGGQGMKTIFDEFGRYILVECKNWEDSVGANQVRDFKAKLDASRVNLGVIFAKNGISGSDSGRYALREIHDIFQRDGIMIIVVNGGELREIADDQFSFYDILDSKMYQIRFRALKS